MVDYLLEVYIMPAFRHTLYNNIAFAPGSLLVFGWENTVVVAYDGQVPPYVGGCVEYNAIAYGGKLFFQFIEFTAWSMIHEMIEVGMGRAHPAEEFSQGYGIQPLKGAMIYGFGDSKTVVYR